MRWSVHAHMLRIWEENDEMLNVILQYIDSTMIFTEVCTLI